VLLFFILLGGTKESTPLNEFYWLQADTSHIPGAPAESRWTLYGVCGVSSDGKNINCTKNTADFAFQPDVTYHTTTGVPQDFINNHDTYYFLTRFAYPFYIIGLFFTVVTFILTFFGLRYRLGAALAATSTFIAFLFVITASCLVTAAYTMARNKFSNGASLGVKMFAFTWTSTALLLLVFIFGCITCCAGRDRTGTSGGFGGPLARESSFEKTGSRRRGFFNVGSKKANENSFFAENESQNPVIGNEASSFDRVRD
jgi:SUR7/PalI family